MRMLRIGLVDLDTSHPGSWLPIISSLGHKVMGVFDGGTVYPKGYSLEFAQKYGVERVFDSLEKMVEHVDLAIIHSCNWDKHIERVHPFADAGKSILIDKPLAGNVKDLYQLLKWERQGIRISGGSGLRFCMEVKEWRNHHDFSECIFAVAGCSVDYTVKPCFKNDNTS